MAKNKKAAMELSMSTIVILVLGVSMLILGMVLIRNIMCTGLQITDQLSTGVKNELKTLFGADKFGVKCLGQGGQEVKFGTGGKRPLVCIFKSDENVRYDLRVLNIESLSGAKTDTVKRWVIDQNWEGNVVPGQDQEETVVLFDIPRDAPNTGVKVTMEAENKDSGSVQTITSIIQIVPTGFARGAIC